MYGKRGRIFAGALALVLIFSSGGISAFADGVQGQAYEVASGGSAEARGEIRNSDGENAGTEPEDVQGTETALEPEDVQAMADYAPAKMIMSRDCFTSDTAMANAHYILRDRQIELKLV